MEEGEHQKVGPPRSWGKKKKKRHKTVSKKREKGKWGFGVNQKSRYAKKPKKTQTD